MSFEEEESDPHGECRHEIERLMESEEAAWVLIANAWGGDWSVADGNWKDAAERWRDKYHFNLPLPPSDAADNSSDDML